MASKLAVMFTQTNTRSNAERFDLEVRKLQSICALHNIPTGATKDLAGFMRKLAGDRHFAMDFWAFIGTLSSREKGELSDEQMLSVIVETVAGSDIPDIPEDDRNLKRQIGDLTNLLAGIDVHNSGIDHDLETPPLAHTDPIGDSVSTNPNSVFTNPETVSTNVEYRNSEQAIANAAADEVHLPSAPSDTPSHTSISPDPVVESKPQLPPSELSVAPSADDALQRLEQKNRELQHYIDEIEARLKRIEPRLEEHIAASKVRIIATGAEGAHKAIEEMELEHKPVGCVRLVLDPDLSTDADAFDMEQADLAERVPLADYPQNDGHGKLILLLLLLVLLAGGGLFAQRQGVSLRALYGSLMQKVHSISAKGNANSTSQSAPNDAVATPPSSPLPSPSSSPAVANSAASSANSAASSTRLPPTPATTSSGALNGNLAKADSAKSQLSAATTNRALPPSGVSTPPAGGKVLSSRSAFVPSSSVDEVVKPPNRAPAEDEADAVRVAPGIMASNLFISRVPIYPDAARASRIQGPVVAQTIIGKDGTVEQVHVVSGDPHLRDAAIAAIQKWHYRPYLLNGRPVPVATTVTVDFRLNR